MNFVRYSSVLKGEVDGDEKTEKPENPRETANPLSVLTFSWLLRLFIVGYKRELEVTDLYSPLYEHRSDVLGDKFESMWNEEKAKALIKNHDPSLLCVISRIFGCDIMFHGLVLVCLELFVRTSQPLFLGRLIRYFTQQQIKSDEEKFVSAGDLITLKQAYWYASGVILCSVIYVLIFHSYMMSVYHIGMKIRVGCCSLIYRKALRLSKTALGQTTVGQIVNLLSNDVNRYDSSVIYMHYLWVGPLETVVVTYFLWQEIGVASIVGVAALLIVIPLQAWLGKKTSSLRLRTAIKTDERVRLMNEIISGIQVIKMYTWEKPFAKLVSYARRKEINVIRKKMHIRGLLLAFTVFHARLAIFLSVFSYAVQGYPINAEKVFVVISYYNILRLTMTVYFPQGISQVAEALVSTKRLQKFMLYDETVNLNSKPAKVGSEKVNGVKIGNSYNKTASLIQQNEYSINMTNVTARWTPDLNENTLNDINIKFPAGKLSSIIGPVGSGKSSLLHAILKELPVSSGSISVNGRISYTSQEPWLFAGSIRQNILFGEPYEKDRYREVTRVCALRTDFEQFPYGDKTVVGDRGVTLSGGQRARINLARAIYKKADIYLLDDPLSAVDSHVGKHLFEECIVDYLKSMTRILITNQLQYLNNIEHIVVLESGSVIAEGSYKKLQESGKDFTKLLLSRSDTEEADVSDKPLHKHHSSVQSVASLVDENRSQQEPQEVAEMRSVGTVGFGVYGAFIRASGHTCSIVVCLLCCILTQILASGGDYWVTYWVNLEDRSFRIKGNEDYLLVNQTINSSSNTSLADQYTREIDFINNSNIISDDKLSRNLVSGPLFAFTRKTCLYIFCAIMVLTVIITIVRTFLFFNMCMKASMRLHDNMFNSITRATMRFFNTNPAGRILNRFSKDMGSIDEMLPIGFIFCVQIGLRLISVITVISIVNYLLLVPTVFIAILFYYLRAFYLATSRSIKRLEGVTRSPVFSHLNASIQGLTTIRAFKAQSILEKEFDNHQDLHSSAWFIFLASSRTFGYWLDVFCVIYISLVTLSFLYLGTETFGGNVGLAITQSIGLTGMIQWGMRQSAELENQMTSVERVLEYSNVEKEPPLESPFDKKPPASWPNEGKIEFSKVFLKYSIGEPHVLKNLSFTINPGEKIGIVGRTGAGKSSLISALYRLAYLDGEIRIDNIDTTTLGLHDIRSKISIIPQEPVLFSGTIRKNLDPFDEYSDSVLWNALQAVELKEAVSDLPDGLNAKMSEGGTNFSVGQRQLVCLGRAIVRKNKILVLDEATANVDPLTDALIQLTIRRKFSECTMLTIAHRLNTVMDSDKVLVMDAGCLVEFDHPYILLKNKEGFLYRMVEQTGKATAETLLNVAAANYKPYIDDPEVSS
ncbi:putative multidrug resistance-associated protein lethal(2)03659 isoform X2 [Lycorma delicatula]|uniref:putative multidrug resistance-associated protein lethal(2)03659 isoform X2 n=1 Tax=Lycorma delicatula TaxID=130591 RepID=UPI003F518442